MSMSRPIVHSSRMSLQQEVRMWICHLFSTRKESRNVAEDCEWKASWEYSMEPASYHKEPSDTISRSTQTLPASVRVSGRVCVRVHTLEERASQSAHVKDSFGCQLSPFTLLETGLFAAHCSTCQVNWSQSSQLPASQACWDY